MIVAAMIPVKFEAIRSKLMFEILCSQAPKLVQSGLETALGSASIVSRLGVPKIWLQTSLALCLQNLNLYEKAIFAWLEAGNPHQAHSIWYEKILPLYMTRGASV